MKRTVIFLRPDQVARLASLSKQSGAPVAELIRRAIDHVYKPAKGAK